MVRVSLFLIFNLNGSLDSSYAYPFVNSKSRNSCPFIYIPLEKRYPFQVEPLLTDSPYREYPPPGPSITRCHQNYKCCRCLPVITGVGIKGVSGWSTSNEPLRDLLYCSSRALITSSLNTKSSPTVILAPLPGVICNS